MLYAQILRDYSRINGEWHLPSAKTKCSIDYRNSTRVQLTVLQKSARIEALWFSKFGLIVHHCSIGSEMSPPFGSILQRMLYLILAITIEPLGIRCPLYTSSWVDRCGRPARDMRTSRIFPYQLYIPSGKGVCHLWQRGIINTSGGGSTKQTLPQGFLRNSNDIWHMGLICMCWQPFLNNTVDLRSCLPLNVGKQRHCENECHDC